MIFQHVPSQPEVVHFICDDGAEEVVAEDNLVREEEVMGEENVVRQEEVVDEENVVREEEVVDEENVVREEEVLAEKSVVQEEEVLAEESVVREEEVLAKDNVVVEEEVVVEENMVEEEEVVVEDVNCEDEEGLAGEKLDDSEKERVANGEDGFGMDIDPPIRKIGPVLDRWKSFKPNSSKVKRKRDISGGAFVKNEEVGVHDINEDYNTDDLDFDVDSDEGVVTVGPNKFKYEDMNKEFKFKLGMEFGSLKDFK